MDSVIQKLIEENIEYIEAGKFDVVYDKAMSVNIKINIGELTDVFYDAGIDPLASLTEIPPLFLDESKITALVVPQNIKKICKAGLAFSNVEHLELHNNCELSESCCHNAELKSIIIPYIMNEVPDECFYNCQELTDVDLNAIEQIGAEAFAYCTSLRSIFIPDDVNYIADTAFEGCDITLYFHNTNECAIEYCQRNNMEYKFV